MFHRKRTPSTLHLNKNPTPSAATAAAQAFLANKASNGQLSSAAAAAALRSQTTTPTPVSDLQTKRSLRRQSSTSSAGSASGSTRGGTARPDLQRRRSNGSMSERSFRDSSSPVNNRASTVDYYDDLPPVPALPRAFSPQNAPAVSQYHRRTASLEAPFRVGSPPPAKATGRGASLDRGVGRGAPGTKLAAQRSSTLANVPEQELERSSRGSINYSYPLAGTNSPPVSPSPESPRNYFDKPARSTSKANTSAPMSSLQPGESTEIQSNLQQVANKPVTKKKKKAAASAPTQDNVPLADRNIGGRPKGTAVNAQSNIQEPSQNAVQEPSTVPEPASQQPLPVPKKKKKKAKAVPAPLPIQDQSASSDLESTSASGRSTPEPPKVMNTRAAGLLTKQPSIVREERELEEREEVPLQSITQPRPSKPSAAASNDSPRNSVQFDSREAAQITADRTRRRQTSLEPANTRSGQGSSSLNDSLHAPHAGRPQSLSPGRSARFSMDPPLMSPNVQRHQPPPRSLSPAKSAMKLSPSPRAGSPAGAPANTRKSRRGPASDTSEVSAPSEAGSSEVGMQKKKKNVRVSFDEEAVLVHESSPPPDSPASPQLLSPQHKTPGKKTWLGFVRGNREDGVNDQALEEEDQTDALKPRPALPSFGSVRGRNASDHGEEPLQQVIENVPATSSEPAESGASRGQLDASNDHAIGGLLAEHHASTGVSTPSSEGDLSSEPAAVKPQESLEPLPPEVTSVEGSGYHSDTEESTQSLAEDEQIHPSGPADTPLSTLDAHPTTAPEEPAPDVPVLDPIPQVQDVKPIVEEHQPEPEPEPEPDLALPTIALSEPTPTGEDHRYSQEWLSIPGQFPTSTDPSDDERSYEPDVVGTQHVTQTPVAVEPLPAAVEPIPVVVEVAEPTPAAARIAEPVTEGPTTSSPPTYPGSGGFAAELQRRAAAYKEEESEDTGSSIYSDAEDFLDPSRDGYGSIDAVLESPVVSSFAERMKDVPTESPKSRGPKADSTEDPALKRKGSEPLLDEGWAKAQTYWSGLSDQRKLELERAASPDPGEARIAQPPQPIIKKKKKKSKQKPSAEAPSAATVSANEGQWLAQPISTNGSRPVEQEPAPSLRPATKAPKASKPPKSGPPGGRQVEQRGDVSLRSSMRDTPSPVPTKKAPSPIDARPMKSSLRQTRPTSTPNMPGLALSPTSESNYARKQSSNSAPNSPRDPPPKKAAAPPLKRTTSNDSDDSASSFRKSRGQSGRGEGFAMRRTMRAPPIPADPPRSSGRPSTADGNAAGNRSSRFSVRSSSPTGSTAGSHTMRASLRSSGGGGAAPSLRSNPPGEQRPKSPSRFAGFGKSNKQPKQKKPSRPQSGISSRFADSSDEEAGPARFSSRFADSSDEEGDVRRAPPIPLTPVRGIPRKYGEDDRDSTDLEDSSEDDTPTRPKSRTGAAKPAPERTALAAGSLRRSGSGRDLTKGISPPDSKKKRSFFGALGRRKDTSKVQKADGESLARLDAPLERTRAELQSTAASNTAYNNNNNNSSPRSPSAGRPKLVKRASQQPQPKRTTSDSWPLTPSGIDGPPGAGGRPTTSDGPSPRSRPDLGIRRATTPAPGENVLVPPPTAANGDALMKKDKKKRFRGLRKAFGMH